MIAPLQGGKKARQENRDQKFTPAIYSRTTIFTISDGSLHMHPFCIHVHFNTMKCVILHQEKIVHGSSLTSDYMFDGARTIIAMVNQK